jgi:hypothetical protein
MLKNVDGGPSGGAGAGDPRAPTINIKTSMVDPRAVPELKIRERPPSTLRKINDGSLGGAGADDPRAPTINAKKH